MEGEEPNKETQEEQGNKIPSTQPIKENVAGVDNYKPEQKKQEEPMPLEFVSPLSQIKLSADGISIISNSFGVFDVGNLLIQLLEKKEVREAIKNLKDNSCRGGYIG